VGNQKHGTEKQDEWKADNPCQHLDSHRSVETLTVEIRIDSQESVCEGERDSLYLVSLGIIRASGKVACKNLCDFHKVLLCHFFSFSQRGGLFLPAAPKG
jgi:hypothetical protein